MADTPTLTFEGKQYDINTLSDEVKQCVTSLQVADQQLRLQQDALNLLSVGRQTIAAQLQQQLANVEPISSKKSEVLS